MTAEALRANMGSTSAISVQRGLVNPKFQVVGVATPTNHSSSQKTRLTVLSYGIKIWTDLSSVLSRIVENELASLDMALNASKSVCIRYGPRFDRSCSEISTNSGEGLRWVSTCRYI